MDTRVEVWKTESPADRDEEFYVILLMEPGDDILAARGPYARADADALAADPDGFVRGLFEEATQKIWTEATFVSKNRERFARVS